MSRKRRSLTPEYKEEAAKLVIETSRPIAESARDIGINEQTLRNWVNAYRKHTQVRSRRCRCRSGRSFGN